LENEIYLPEDAHLALVGDLACELTFYHNRPADCLKAVTVVLADYGLAWPALAKSLAEAEPWPCTEVFDPEQVLHMLDQANVCSKIPS
jgi:hypothetical protein